MSSSISNEKKLELEFEFENENIKNSLKILVESYIESTDKKIFHAILGFWFVAGKGDKSPENLAEQLDIMIEMNDNEILEYANYILDRID